MTTITKDSVPYPVRRFWNAAYVAGTRITFHDQRFHFERAELPLVRIVSAGNRFGVFPKAEPVEPAPWILDGIEEHNGALVDWLSAAWPKALTRFAWQMLVLEYELRPLTRYAATLGHFVDGWAGEGGWIPSYGGAIPARKIAERGGLPPILADWQEVKF